MKNQVFLLCVALIGLSLAACNKDETIVGTPKPVITLDDPDGIYSVKPGKTLTITPVVEHAEGAVYSWHLDGTPAGTGPTFTYRAEQPGTYYLVFRVTNAGGSAEEELRIDVRKLLPPMISFTVGADSILMVEAGHDRLIAPVIANGEDATFRWTLNGEPVGTEAAYIFNRSELKDYSLRLRAENEDGSDERGITVRVVERFEGAVYFPAPYCFPAQPSGYRPGKSVALGRTLVLKPYVENFRKPAFAWTVNGEPAQPKPGSDGSVLAFTPSAAGDYTVVVTATDPDGMSATATVPVRCCEYSPRTAADNPYIDRVYEYTAAPGQFIGEGAEFAAVADAEGAAAYAQARLLRNAQEGTEYFISLGAWGGSIVVGFDHSIANRGGHNGYDFSIAGNQFDTSSEAGIVWVMQDSDGNGLPDDEWYELRGSEYGGPNQTTQYALTYYRPVGARMAVRWTDNRGGAGEIPVNSFHMQDTYYPRWIAADSYTLYGSKLAANTTVDPVTGDYVNRAYPWGYADNQGTDNEAGDNPQAKAKKTYFRIANAVHADGTPAELPYIDFIRVQTAISHVAGRLGEISTEIVGFEDENL